MVSRRVHRDLFALLALIVLATYALAVALSRGHLEWGDIVLDYAKGFSLVALVGITVLVMWCQLLAIREKRRLVDKCREYFSDPLLWARLAIPTLMAPVFLASFTVLKSLIGMRLGFGWDATFANLDSAIFGTDPWRLTHAVFGPWATRYLQFWHVVWGGIMAFSMVLVPLLTPRVQGARFLLAMFLVWLVTGLLLAAVFSSAGPCFAYKFHPDLAARFEPLRVSLRQMLAGNGAILMTQAYLAEYWNAPIATQGGGISAFPSVHVAVAVLYVLAAWRYLPLRIVAIAFAITIWIGSIHTGYHYAVDGLATLIIVPVCWVVSGRIVRFVVARHAMPEPLRGAQPAG